jgi:hypothetical protein
VPSKIRFAGLLIGALIAASCTTSAPEPSQSARSSQSVPSLRGGGAVVRGAGSNTRADAADANPHGRSRPFAAYGWKPQG